MRLLFLIMLTLSLFHNKLNSQVFFSSGCTVYVSNGALVHVNGGCTIDQTSTLTNQGEITIASALQPGTFTINNASNVLGDGLYRVQQDWINNANFSGGNSTVELFGNTQQFITSLNGTITTFHNLTLSGSGTGNDRKKTLQGVDANVDATGVLNINDRELATQSQTFTVLNPAVNSVSNNQIAGSEGFVSSIAPGTFARYTNSTGTYLFPTGSSLLITRYRPIDIVPNGSNNDVFTVRFVNNDANNDGYFRTQNDGSFCQANDNYYHAILRPVGTDAADIRMYYLPLSDGNWSGMAHWRLSNMQWNDMSVVTPGIAGVFSTLTRAAWLFTNPGEPYILTVDSPNQPVINTSAATCSSNGTATITNYSAPPLTYSFVPAGPTVGASGVISGLTPNTNYTVTASVGLCNSLPSSSFSIGAQLPTPSAPTASVTQPTCTTATGSVAITAPVPAVGTTFTLTGTAPVVTPQTNATGTFTNLTPGNYTVIVTVSGCNSSTTSLTVNTQPVTPNAPTATVTAQPTCTNGSGTITVTSPTPGMGVTYTVAGTSPVVAPQSNSTGIFSGLAPGTYSVITTVNGCNSPLTTLTVNAQPATPAAPTASVTTPATCSLPTGTITVTAPIPVAGTTYTVTGTAPVVAPQTNTTGVFSGLIPGTYNVTTTVGGCTSTATVVIVSPPVVAPTISVVSSNDVTCNGGNNGDAEVSGSGGTGTLTYLWTPGNLTGATQSGLTAGTYTVQVTDQSGCTNSTTVTIGQPLAITIVETITPSTCGSADGAISVVASGGTPVYTYSWTPGGSAATSITGLIPGNYSLTVTDQEGCSATENYIVILTGSLNVDATPEISTINQGESVQFNTTGAATFSWSPSSTLDCSDCPDPIATPTATTMYIVTGTDASGCTGIDTVYVNVIPEPVECGEIFVPTVLSPNGTGPAANKMICVYGGCVAEITFAIYNRWGEKVFETTDVNLTECWDGTYRGKEMNSGTFAYKLIVTLTTNETIEESGNITLVR